MCRCGCPTTARGDRYAVYLFVPAARPRPALAPSRWSLAVEPQNRERTPLLIACEKGYVDVAQYLVGKGACVADTCAVRTPRGLDN